MRSLAERHKRTGQIAEAVRQYDRAAHEYFQAYRHYRAAGNTKDADEMTTLEQRALSKMILLSDSAREFEAQAFKLASHVAEMQPADGSLGELRALAASLYEEAASRYVALAGRVLTASRKPHFLRKAAADLRSASALESDQMEALACRALRLEEDAEILSRVVVAPEESAPPEIALAWLRRLGRPRCRICDRLWQDYSTGALNHDALQALLTHDVDHDWRSNLKAQNLSSERRSQA
jgi:hypothetical protein